MVAKTKKATFNLHKEVLEALDELVSQGIASSKNALVEQALVKELKELRRRARRTQWEEAMKDPLFLKDLEEVERDFRYVDAEALENADK